MRGRKPKPRANSHKALGALPRCPAHLSEVARREWRRLAPVLHSAGILTVAEGTSLEFVVEALGPKVVDDYAGEASWQELSKQDPLSFDKNRCFQIVGNETLQVPLARMVDPGLTEGMTEWVTGHVLRHHLGMDEEQLEQLGYG